MNRKLPWLALGLGVLVLFKAFSPRRPENGFDTAAFARLPALHNGRVKPLDTIARNALLVIRGKQTFSDSEGRRSAAAWLLELAAEPAAADARKTFLIHDPDLRGIFGLRDEKQKYFSFSELAPGLLELDEQNRRASAVDVKLRSRFQSAVVQLDGAVTLYQRLKNTLRPADGEDFDAELDAFELAAAEGQEAFQAHRAGGRDFMASPALSRLGLFFRRYGFLAQAAYAKVVPPPPGAAADDWTDAGTALLRSMASAEVPRTVRLYDDALRAYSAGDPAAFSRAVGGLSALAEVRAPAAAANARRETLFNHVEPFYQGMILYVLVFLLICLSWLWRPEPARRAAFWVLSLALFTHTAGLLARMWLQGRPPVTNLYSSAIFVGWAAVLFAWILERVHKRGFAALAASIVGFCTLIVAHHLAMSGDTLEMMQAVLDSNFWLGTHVVTITIGYSSTFLAALFALVWIVRRAAGRLDAASSRALAQMTYGVVCFSLLLSFVGTMLGGIWADQSWGRFWGWDPKENGALLIVLWHALILHARWGGYIKERGLMCLAVGGGIVCSLSWFGVNMLGIGLHSYGFMDKAFWWLSGFIASQLLFIAVAFLPESFLSSSRWGGARKKKTS